jgi:hypothetical protein
MSSEIEIDVLTTSLYISSHRKDLVLCPSVEVDWCTLRRRPDLKERLRTNFGNILLIPMTVRSSSRGLNGFDWIIRPIRRVSRLFHSEDLQWHVMGYGTQHSGVGLR